MVAQAKETEELLELQTLEKIVETVWVAFAKGYAALGEILAKKLYKAAGYKTEDEYLEKRWGELSRSQLFNKKRMAKLAVAIGSEHLPEGIRESHLACLTAFNDEPQLQREILEEAAKMAGNNQLTADHVDKAASKLLQQRDAALKAQKEEESRRATILPIGQDDDEEEEAEEEEQAPAPKPAPSRASTTIGRAAAHPIADEGRQRKKIGQAIRTVRKLDRIALELNMTREDLLEQFDSGELEERLKGRAA